MPRLITPEYLELQKDLHARYDYGRGVDARECADRIRSIAALGASVLDYGCGQGHLGALLRPDYDVRDYDPCIDGKDAPPDPADHVVCADVLEHVEPECLEDVLSHIRDLTRERAILVIATGPSGKIMKDGRPAHLIVEDAAWWRRRIERHFFVHIWEDRSARGRGIMAEVI